MLDRVIPHGVVESDLLACGDGLAGDEVVSAAGVEADPQFGSHEWFTLVTSPPCSTNRFSLTWEAWAWLWSSSRSMTPTITVSPTWKDRVANTPAPLVSVRLSS